MRVVTTCPSTPLTPSSRQDPLAIDGSCASIPWASVDWRRSLQHTSRAVCFAQVHLQNRTGARQSASRDPPHLQSQLSSRRLGVSSVRACRVSATDGSLRLVARRELSLGSSEPPVVCHQVATSSESRTLRSARGGFVCVAISDARRNIGEAQVPAVDFSRRDKVLSRQSAWQAR